MFVSVCLEIRILDFVVAMDKAKEKSYPLEADGN